MEKIKTSLWKQECNKFMEQATGKILDVGCGKFPYPNATTVDFLSEYKPNFVADVQERLPFKDNSFDTVILNNTLEHLHSPQKAISECGRVLKPKGVLLVAVPFLAKIHQEPHDYLRYTEFMLRRLFPNAEITPSEVSFTEQIKSQLKSLSGLKIHPISKLIYLLSRFLPEIHHKRYVQGYLIKEVM